MIINILEALDKSEQSEEELNQTLKEIDENNDGQLSKREVFLFVLKSIGYYDEALEELKNAGIG